MEVYIARSDEALFARALMTLIANLAPAYVIEGGKDRYCL
jgi:hypothetical protein